MTRGWKTSDLTKHEWELADAIYEAALDATLWPGTTERVARACGGHAGVYVQFVPADRKMEFVHEYGFDGSSVWGQSHHIDNPWTHRGFLPVGKVRRSDDLCPLSVLEQSSWYREFLGPADADHSLLSVVSAGDGVLTTFSVSRSRRRGPFDDEAVDLLSRLVPRIGRATEVARRLAQAEAQTSDLGRTLDRLSAAVFLVDGSGRVCCANESAEQLARRGDMLAVRCGRLMVVDPGHQDRLQKLIRAALGAADGRGVPPGGCLTLDDPEGRSVDVLVTPLGRDTTSRLLRRPRAMVLVGGAPTPKPPVHALLREIYGLTCAEAWLTLALVDHDDLATAAEALGTSLNTARTHLKRVFGKTGCRRQSDLMRRLLRGPLALREASGKSSG